MIIDKLDIVYEEIKRLKKIESALLKAFNVGFSLSSNADKVEIKSEEELIEWNRESEQLREEIDGKNQKSS